MGCGQSAPGPSAGGAVQGEGGSRQGLQTPRGDWGNRPGAGEATVPRPPYQDTRRWGGAGQAPVQSSARGPSLLRGSCHYLTRGRGLHLLMRRPPRAPGLRRVTHQWGSHTRSRPGRTQRQGWLDAPRPHSGLGFGVHRGEPHPEDTPRAARTASVTTHGSPSLSAHRLPPGPESSGLGRRPRVCGFSGHILGQAPTSPLVGRRCLYLALSRQAHWATLQLRAW